MTLDDNGHQSNQCTAAILCSVKETNLVKSMSMVFIDTVVTFLKDDEYRELVATTFVVILAGSIVYHYVEEWSWIDSIYFSIITLTTVGYGDFSPQTDIGKVFTIFYIILGIGIILTFVNTLYMHYARSRFGKERQTENRHKKDR